MRKFIVHSTIFSIFSEALLFNYIIDLKIFYVIIFLNIVLITFIQPIKISKSLLTGLSLIFSCGLLSIALGTNTLSRLTSQFFGIAIVAIYYYNFFRIENKGIDYYFKIYSNYSFYIAVIGIIMFIVKLPFEGIRPVKSIMLEPAHFVTAMLPACYYWFKNREVVGGMKKFLVIITSIILSFSSLGILGLMIGTFLLPKKISFSRLFVPIVVAVVAFIVIIQNVSSFEMRVNDTVNSFVNNDLSDANLSSYALISNLFVAAASFKQNPIIGGGLGSHILSHEKFIDNVTGSDTFGELINLNAQDANSLFIRVASELGLFGVAIVLIFIFRNYVKQPGNLKWISRAILLYFFCKLLREGHYFSPEMYFFVFAYFYAYKESKSPVSEPILQLT